MGLGAAAGALAYRVAKYRQGRGDPANRPAPATAESRAKRPTRSARRFIERAEAGVEVNLVLDRSGSAKLDEAHPERLREAGVNVSIFRPPRPYALKKLNNRMHWRIP